MAEWRNVTTKRQLHSIVSVLALFLFLSNSCRWLITLPGLMFNCALLYTIISEKNLHGTCATLLAIGSVVDFFYLLSFSVPFALSLVGQNMISNFGCFFLQFLPNFGLFSSVWIIFFVGIDRLISVLFPIRYGLFEEHNFIYILPMLTVTFGYSIYVLGEAAKWALFVYPDWPVLCTNSNMFSFGMSTMLLRNDPSSVLKHRIFKSLASIMTFLAGTYFAICFIRLLLASVTDPIFILHISPFISALLTVTAASSNAPILFAFSNNCQLLSPWLPLSTMQFRSRAVLAVFGTSQQLEEACRKQWHPADFSNCGISDFEPDLDNVPNVKIGTNHIYKGRPVENANSMPWMVTLLTLNEILCTGTIISHKYILTAYHCICNILSVPSSIQISYGTVNVSNKEHITNARHIIRHPNASRSEMHVKIYGSEIGAVSLSNDLAIIEVENAIKFSPNVRPICLFGFGWL
ncbi:hypothetical protein niasHS_000110 [Heterodera schachtii]|uniref:Uncharacterized protein n=1 Tax=Heterodera schachtii TaxID=97005 RepID=A0ABD2K780_HETSC